MLYAAVQGNTYFVVQWTGIMIAVNCINTHFAVGRLVDNDNESSVQYLVCSTNRSKRFSIFI